MTTTPKTKARQRLLGRIRVPEGGSPTHPGKMLFEEFLKPLGVSRQQMAEAVQLPGQQVDQIIDGQQPVTPAVALRLAKYLGMSTTFWVNLQLRWDLYHALQADAAVLEAIEPLPRPDLPELLELAGIEEKDSE